MLLHEEIATRLDALGIGAYSLTGGGNIFCFRLAPEPDRAISVAPTGGYPEPGSTEYKNPTVQLMARAEIDGDEWAISALRAAYNDLHAVKSDHLTTGGTYIIGCQGLQSEPHPIGPDENGRPRYVLNLLLYTKEGN